VNCFCFRFLVLISLLTASVASGCERSKPAPVAPEPPPPVVADSLQLVRTVLLTVPEPSDMCLDRDGEHWWTVSDQTGLVYQLRLSDGGVVRTLGYHGTDPEGIWQDPADGTFYVAEELNREVVHIDSTGHVLSRVTVAGLGGDANSGLEGITSGPVTGSFYLTQEKGPARLVVAGLDGVVMATYAAGYVSDLSGATRDPRTGQPVVVSDESHKVCWVTPAGELVKAWAVAIDQAEGVAVDTLRSRVYVVSDREQRFYEFRLP
jgi:uncharacterized protein YjiK